MVCRYSIITTINDEKHSALTLHVDQFKEQMEYLHNHGYNTITLDQLYDYLQNGTELPDKPIVITSMMGM